MSRPRMSTEQEKDLVELRGLIGRNSADVLDAVAQAQELTRMDVVNQVLNDWAKRRLHEATLIVRVTRCNGSAPEVGGSHRICSDKEA